MPRNIFIHKPPLEKLPLAVRKALRDDFEPLKAKLEIEIAEKLGIPTFTINFNVNEVWPYSSEGTSSSAGTMMGGYAEGFACALTQLIDEYGDDGRAHFNNAVTRSELGLAVNELGDKGDTISADIKDGVFRILFRQDSLGYNQSYIFDPLLKAIESAPRSPGEFALVAKNSIQKYWTVEMEDLLKEMGDILAMPDVVLDPNFEHNYAALEKGKKDDQYWKADFGRMTFAYFNDGLKYQLQQQGFEADDMLQEGLSEVVTSKIIKLRVVDSTKNNQCNEVVVENGIVYIQMTPYYWGYNMSDAGSGLLDLL